MELGINISKFGCVYVCADISPTPLQKNLDILVSAKTSAHRILGVSIYASVLIVAIVTNINKSKCINYCNMHIIMCYLCNRYL